MTRKFPFSTSNEKGHCYTSIHDVAEISVEGPELITVDSEQQQTYWSSTIIVTTKHGDTFVIGTIADTDQNDKPTLKLSDKTVQRKPGWWKKQ